MSLVGTQVKEITAQGFQKGKFLTVTQEDFTGKWKSS